MRTPLRSNIMTAVGATWAIFALSGCQTVNDQSPIEVQAAKQAVDKAETAGVDDFMPSAYEAAKRRLDRSVEMLHESAEYQSSNETTQAQNTHAEAIKLAVEAKTIADSGTRIVEDMHRFNDNSGEYISLNERADRAVALQGELDQTRTQLTQLQGEYEGAIRTNEDLANRPAEVVSEIPADFRVAKPMAYFQSGSTTLEARFRPDIQELAAMLKKNPDLEVKLEGFADPRGSAALNQRLAEQRLQAVANELKAQGVNEKQLNMVTVGETADSAAGASSGSLQLDRKVTATVSVIAH